MLSNPPALPRAPIVCCWWNWKGKNGLLMWFRWTDANRADSFSSRSRADTPHGEYRLLQEGDDWVLQFNIISTGSRCTVLISASSNKAICNGQFLVCALAAVAFSPSFLMCRHLPDGGKLTLTNFHFTIMKMGTRWSSEIYQMWRRYSRDAGTVWSGRG